MSFEYEGDGRYMAGLTVYHNQLEKYQTLFSFYGQLGDEVVVSAQAMNADGTEAEEAVTATQTLAIDYDAATGESVFTATLITAATTKHGHKLTVTIGGTEWHVFTNEFTRSTWTSTFAQYVALGKTAGASYLAPTHILQTAANSAYGALQACMLQDGAADGAVVLREAVHYGNDGGTGTFPAHKLSGHIGETSIPWIRFRPTYSHWCGNFAYYYYDWQVIGPANKAITLRYQGKYYTGSSVVDAEKTLIATGNSFSGDYAEPEWPVIL